MASAAAMLRSRSSRSARTCAGEMSTGQLSSQRWSPRNVALTGFNSSQASQYPANRRSSRSAGVSTAASVSAATVSSEAAPAGRAGASASVGGPPQPAAISARAKGRVRRLSMEPPSAGTVVGVSRDVGVEGAGLVLAGIAGVFVFHLIQRGDLLQPRRGDQEADEDHRAKDHDLAVAFRKLGHVVAAELAGKQPGQQVAEGGAEEPHAHHLAVIAARRELGGGRQAD